MKLENVNNIVQKIGDSETIQGEFSKEDMEKIWELVQNPYKDSIAAVVREYVSNAVDSHVAINNPDPVIVRIIREDTLNSYQFQVEDFGLGLSPDDMENIFMKYGKSTKEKSNDFIGAFGIGSKSGLSYQNAITIISRFNGIEYIYILRKGELGPALDKILSIPTTEKNGVCIKVDIKNYSDAKSFFEAIQKQLAYFENIYYEICPTINKGNIDLNNLIIFSGDNFKLSQFRNPNGTYSENSVFNRVHIILGKVAYPIDMDKLEQFDYVDKIPVPIGLKFNIGELKVTPSREDIKYTKEVQELIINRLVSAINEINDKFSQFIPTDDIYHWYGNIFHNQVKIGEISYELGDTNFIKGTLFYFSPFEEFKYILNNTIKPFTSSVFNLLFDYKLTAKYYRTGHSREFRYYDKTLHAIFSSDKYEDKTFMVYRAKEELSSKKTKYIASFLPHSYNSNRGYNEVPAVYIVRQNKKSLRNYIQNLNMHVIPRHKWREFLTIFQKEMSKLIISLTESYDKVIVPKSIAQNNRRTVGEEKILVNIFEKNKYNDIKVGTSEILSLKELTSKNALVLYTIKTDVSPLFSIIATTVLNKGYRNRKQVYLLGVNKTDIKKYLEPNNIGIMLQNTESILKYDGRKAEISKKLIVDSIKGHLFRKFTNSFYSTLFRFNFKDIMEIKKYYEDFDNQYQSRYEFKDIPKSVLDLAIRENWIDIEFFNVYYKLVFFKTMFPINVLNEGNHFLMQSIIKECPREFKMHYGEKGWESIKTDKKNFIDMSKLYSDSLYEEVFSLPEELVETNETLEEVVEEIVNTVES